MAHSLHVLPRDVTQKVQDDTTAEASTTEHICYLLSGDILFCLLSFFTKVDAQHYLSVVCRPLNNAVKAARTLEKNKPFRPCMSLHATLERLRRRYTPGDYEAAAAVASTLYRMRSDKIMVFWEYPKGEPGEHTPAEPSILGLYGFWVLDTPEWRRQLLQLANTHPAFRLPNVTRYAYNTDHPIWCVYEVLQNFGLRCVDGTQYQLFPKWFQGNAFSESTRWGPRCCTGDGVADTQVPNKVCITRELFGWQANWNLKFVTYTDGPHTNHCSTSESIEKCPLEFAEWIFSKDARYREELHSLRVHFQFVCQTGLFAPRS